MATINVTNSKTFVTGDTVYPADLNQLGLPTVSVSDIVNADISSSAAIAVSKLGNMTAGTVLVGNASNVATSTTLTGDVTVSSSGVTAIGDAKVTSAMLSQPLTVAPAQATTSGTSIAFTGIPTWAKRITVIFNGVSTSGTSRHLVQLGTSSGVVSSGYVSFCGQAGNGDSNDKSQAGFIMWHNNAADTKYAHMVITKVSGNTWVSSHFGGFAQSPTAQNVYFMAGGGNVTLSGNCDRAVITTVNGTDTFDAGSATVLYEG